MSSQDDESRVAQERLRALLSSVKSKSTLWAYGFLALLMYFAFWIRTRNLPLLRDVSTGGWALGPDLDPYLFLRWAEHIVANGTIMAQDTMRYVPLGFDTSNELLLLPYMIAWFHHFLAFFGLTDSVTHSAVLFPAVMFSLTIAAFFFMSRTLVKDIVSEGQANSIALIASFFLIVIPSLLPRTIAGIPEKESIGFLFMFLAFFFFIKSWQVTHTRAAYGYAGLAALATTAMALSWGGYIYVFVTIGLTGLIVFLYNQVTPQKMQAYLTWLLLSIVFILYATNRYTLLDLLTSPTTAIAFGAGGAMIIHSLRLRYKTTLPYEHVLPAPLYTLMLLGLAGAILSTLFFGISFIPDQLVNIKNVLVSPITDRLGVTVAENRQPYLTEWQASFGGGQGPLATYPLFFILFLIGAGIMVWHVLKETPRIHRLGLTGAFIYFLCAIIYSRYNASSILNGTNTVSLFFYASGFLVLGGVVLKQYFSSEQVSPTHISPGIWLLFALFFFSIISARGSVRTIMVLVPAASIFAGYLAVMLGSHLIPTKEKYSLITFSAGLGIIVLLLTSMCAWTFTEQSLGYARSFGPSLYTQQWQEGMAWVRENTPADAVFTHWWDYGYWVQSIGKRATMLDGGNALPYWNHLMGRWGLTGPSPAEALTLFYTHKVSYLLIDSTDIGKYGAFSSIGSDAQYDRRSYLPTLIRTQKIGETKNGTSYLYEGGFSLDGDIIYQENGTSLFLPGGSAGIGGLSIEFDKKNKVIKQPLAIAVHQGKQYSLKIRYLYQNETLIDFGSGIDAGIMLYPRLTNQNGAPSFQEDTAALYLSPRVIHSQLARLYLFDEQIPGFTLVLQQEDKIIAELKRQNAAFQRLVFAQDELYPGVRGSNFAGPLKIWKITYAPSQQINETYAQTMFPDARLKRA